MCCFGSSDIGSGKVGSDLGLTGARKGRMSSWELGAKVISSLYATKKQVVETKEGI